MGPQLAHNLLKLDIEPQVRAAVTSLGLDLDELVEHEEEPGLGNGGLGRLAACFMDSLATLDIPAIGHGIRYEFGIFDQEIRDGWQVEIDRSLASPRQPVGGAGAGRSSDRRARRSDRAHRRRTMASIAFDGSRSAS